MRIEIVSSIWYIDDVDRLAFLIGIEPILFVHKNPKSIKTLLLSFDMQYIRIRRNAAKRQNTNL